MMPPDWPSLFDGHPAAPRSSCSKRPAHTTGISNVCCCAGDGPLQRQLYILETHGGHLYINQIAMGFRHVRSIQSLHACLGTGCIDFHRTACFTASKTE